MEELQEPKEQKCSSFQTNYCEVNNSLRNNLGLCKRSNIYFI